MKTFRKAATEEIFQGFDYGSRMRDGDKLTASEWSVESGLTAGDATFNSTSSEIELKGGTVGTQYLVSNTVTTDKGSVYKRSFKVMVVDR